MDKLIEYIKESQYYTYIQKINEQKYRKFYIVDLRRLNHDVLNVLLDDFSYFLNFQELLLQNDFFSRKDLTLFLYFICDLELKKDYRIQKIIKDIRYGVKKFLTEEELDIIMKNQQSRKTEELQRTILLPKQQIDLRNFNVLYGDNGSGKTTLLKDISNVLQIPYYSLLETINLPDTPNEYKNYLKIILEKTISELSYFSNFIKVLNYIEEQKIPLLLDDLSWNSLSDINLINIIDILADISYDHLTIVTACQPKILELIRTRVYKPNIIECH